MAEPQQRAYPRVFRDLTGYERRTRQGPCFVCGIVRGDSEQTERVVFRDDRHIAFLNRYPTLYGYVLLAPVRHVEDVIDGFTESEYLDLQRTLHRLGRAISAAVPTERLYVLSLGSKQGNAHVHWHLAPLPPGVPYPEQQYHALRNEAVGDLAIPEADQAELVTNITAAMRVL